MRRLRKGGLEFTWARVESGPALIDALKTRCPDLIISDYAMPAFSGPEALAIAISHDPEIPIIILTGELNPEAAVACFEAGAWDYVLKEHHARRLPFAVRAALVRKRALVDASESREALLESERRYRTLANSGRTLVWTSGPTRKCDDVNQPWLDFTGRTLEQELGDGWVEGIHRDDLGRCVETYTSAFDRRQPFSSVFRMRRHDGEYRWIQNDGTPRYDASGTFLGYIGHCLDITDLLRAEQDRNMLEAGLIQAQRMEAVGRLAAGVAHDFNNLLTGILGICDLLQASMAPDSPDRADVEQIQAIAMRASTLTRQLLAFSRKQRLQQIRLNLTKLVSDLRKPLQTVVREHIDLAWDLAADLDDVDGDPGQIEQAVYNLVANACDAMPGGGQLTIRTSQVTLDDAFVSSHAGARPGAHVAISVTDTGPGNRSRVPAPGLRTVLPDEGPRRGDGSRDGRRLRHRQTERRLRDGRERGRPRIDLHHVASRRRTAPSCRLRPGTRTPASTPAGPRRSSSSRMKPVFAPCSGGCWRGTDTRSSRPSTGMTPFHGG